jgi:hypothetical protein
MAFLALAAPEARACNVPVFRYALERWVPEPYVAYVFHRGPLAAEQAALVERLTKAGRGDSPDGSLFVAAVDVAGPMDEGAAAAWKGHESAALPFIVVCYPEVYGVPWDAWSGPLSGETLGAIVDSPARREFAKRIIAGDSSVWLLLESGDKAKDDAAAAVLAAELKRLKDVLELPAPVDGSWDDPVYDAQGAPPQLKIAFSVLRLARTDPAEGALVSMLLGIEEDLRASAEPIAIPIYGRGRALYALVGKGIGRDNIEELCAFMVGPCSCIVKEQNPGIDILTTVDWEAALASQESAVRPVDLPPLEGLARFSPDEAAGGDLDGPSGVLIAPALAGVAAGLIGVAIIGVGSLFVWKRWQRRDT